MKSSAQPHSMRWLSRALRAVLLLTAVALETYAGGAQAAGESDPALTWGDAAAIMIDGRILAEVRGMSAYPAARRAREIEARIEAFAADPKLDPAEIRIEPEKDMISIVGPSGRLLNILEVDVQYTAGDLSPMNYAEAIQVKVREAITAYREDRTPAVIAVRVGYAALLTLFASALFGAGRWAFRRFSRWVTAHVSQQLERVEEKSYNLLQAEQLWRVFHGGVRTLMVLAAATFAYVYINAVLGLFPWTRGIAARLFDFVVVPLRTAGEAILGYLPDLVSLFIVLLISRYLLRLLRALFSAVSQQRVTFQNFDPEWAWPTYRLVRTLVWIFALILAYPYIPGSDSEAFKGVTIFLGVLASIGSSSIISNIVAGYSMTYRRAFQLGDRVRIGETIGDVTEMRLLVTHLRTLKNEEVVIPNSVILSSAVTNYSTLAKESGLILHAAVGIGYEVPWRQVEAMLLLAARRTSGLTTNRDPFVLITNLGDFAVTYELNVYIQEAQQMPVAYRALYRSILDAFNEYDVAIMTPAYVSDPEQPKVVPREQWYAAPAERPAGAGSASPG